MKLTFRDGKIVGPPQMTQSALTKSLTKMKAHAHWRICYWGESLYQNPMKDILFDEKIDGSIHFTPGQAYDEAFNGNKSSIHWDMVLIQRPEWGGGEIYFDDVLIRKDALCPS
ncbi:hypothetical protein EEL30_27280 [Brevibacillus laterosporus]|uniref:Aminopeptidase n=1 Tax=Brevibacillus laterosporus TaxID=1465 RepID=A0A518VF58_BRELA|nr:hypothetical protein EEL30_27280 [Brevibacillus laterosporus]